MILKNWSLYFAFWSLFAGLPMMPIAYGQQPSSLTFSCNGTSKLTATVAAEFKPDPITSLGLIVNFADRTVTFSDYVVPVTGLSATLVSFSGSQQPQLAGKPFGKQFLIDGSIDRVTGHTEIDWMYEVVGNNAHWELTCRPGTRLF
jgi:hypothetical protein